MTIRNGETVIHDKTGKKYHLVKPWLYWTMISYLLINFVTGTIPYIVNVSIPAVLGWFS